VSNARKPGTGIPYRVGYLRSVAWFRRRDRWFAEQVTRTGALRCVVCWQIASSRVLELHHLDYSHVARVGLRWAAGEQHEHLCAMHSECHELVHRILDTDPVLRRHRTRPVATIQAIGIARTRLAAADRPRQ
jgi:5-methylcytosine-specific restriction protein A